MVVTKINVEEVMMQHTTGPSTWLNIFVTIDCQQLVVRTDGKQKGLRYPTLSSLRMASMGVGVAIATTTPVYIYYI